MRRQIIILIAVLLVALPLAAQYPGKYYEQPLPLANGQCVQVEAYLSAYLDMNPWSMPDPTGAYFLFGTLCAEGDSAVLTFEEMASRKCRQAPWGSVDDKPICDQYFAVRPLRNIIRHVLPWVADNTGSGFYLASMAATYPFWNYESLTYHGNNCATYVEGVFEFVTPLWYLESDLFTRRVYDIAPRTAQPLTIRRGGERR